MLDTRGSLRDKKDTLPALEELGLLVEETDNEYVGDERTCAG